MQSLLRRLDRLPDEFRELREGLHRAVKMAGEDPEMSLTRTRKVLEYVVRDVYRRRCKEEPGTRPLENLQQRLVKDGHLPKKLGAYANAIRELGNLGTHAFGEHVSEADAQQSLTHLTSILEWYFKTERPDAVSGADTKNIEPPLDLTTTTAPIESDRAPAGPLDLSRTDALDENGGARRGENEEESPRHGSRGLSVELSLFSKRWFKVAVTISLGILLIVSVGSGGMFLWIRQRANSKIEALKKSLVGEPAGRTMTPYDIAYHNSRAVVKIKVAWHLNAPDGRQLYQLYASNLPKGLENAPVQVSREGIPCWVLIDGNSNPPKIEPFLYDGTAMMIPGNSIKGFSKPVPISGYGTGSGFVVSSDGFILTARRVAARWKHAYQFPQQWGIVYDRNKRAPIGLIKPEQVPTNWVPDRTQQELGGLFEGKNDSVEIVLPGGTPVTGKLVNASPHDVALIKANLPDAMPKVELNNYDEMEEGDEAVLLGYPTASPSFTHVTIPQDFFNREVRKDEIPDPILSVGNVGRILRGNDNPQEERNIFSGLGDVYQLVITTSGEGNTGGPVFDDHGNVIGIFIIARNDMGTALSFAVPIKYGRELMAATGGR